MKRLIHVLCLVLPLAAHADTWVLGGEAIIPPAVVVSPDNLGNHMATGTLDLAGNTVSNVNRLVAAEAGGDFIGDWTLNGSAIGGAAAGDNLGDHVATNTLDLGTNRLSVNVEGGMVPWQLGAVLDEGGIYPMPQFRGTRSGSPYAAGLMLAGANDGDVLAWDSVNGWYRPLPVSGGAGDNLGNHTATNTLNMGGFAITQALSVAVGIGGDDTNTIAVSGAGTADANGIYTRDPDGEVYNDGAAHPGWTNANGLTVIWVDSFGPQHHLWNTAGAHAWYNTGADIEGTWSSYLGAPQDPTAAFGEAGSVAITPAGVVFPDLTMQTTAFVGNSATVTVSGVEFHFSHGAFVEAITP